MPKRVLSPSDEGKSGKITLPKGDLELDGVVSDGEVERHPVDVRRTGRGRYEVVVLDDNLRPLDLQEREHELAEPEAAD